MCVCPSYTCVNCWFLVLQVIGVQLLAILTIGCWSALIAFLQIYIIGQFIHFRFSDFEETKGADWCEHGIDHDTERIVRTSGRLSTPELQAHDDKMRTGAWDNGEGTVT